MARDAAWEKSARRISSLMRKDTVEVYKSVPVQDDVGEWSDSLELLGEYKANVTTPTESIDEQVQGTTRTHPYQITLDPDVPLPSENKIFIKLISTRQGRQGAMLEVSSISGGLLGQTLTADDEQY